MAEAKAMEATAMEAAATATLATVAVEAKMKIILVTCSGFFGGKDDTATFYVFTKVLA